MCPMTDSEPTVQQVKAALSALEKAVVGALAAVRNVPSGQPAFRAATELADLLREAAEAGSALRSETVRRIRDDERLSLAGLAEVIGVSKARAGQLAGPARSTPKEER